MEDEKILEMLKKEGEKLEIPESIQPENIRKKLEQKPRRVLKYKRFYTGLSAVACLALVVSGVYWQRRVVKEPLQTEEPVVLSNMEGENGEKAVAAAPDLSVHSYQEIYEALKISEFLQPPAYETKASVEMAGETGAAKTAKDSGVGKTNLQTEGVDEGEIIKNDGTYLYQLQTDYNTGKSNIRIVLTEADGAVKEVSKISGIGMAKEFYLYDNKLVALEEDNTAEKPQTSIHVLDLTDKNNPQKIKTISQDGSYETSRISDGYLYTFTHFYAEIEQKKKKESYIPTVDGQILREDCIILPKRVMEPTYLLITALPLSNPEHFSDTKGMISAGNQYYVSGDHIYTAGWNDSMSYNTKINSYAYHEGKILPESSGTVPGYLNDSFSMDAYQGYLRVVTTTQGRTGTENGLYILDSEMNIIGKITGLAKGEAIYSARFFGDTGYFVTFRNTDPLFSVDLSDPANPKLLGELKIPGFSEYLHFYDETHLLGIGSEIDPQNGYNLGVKLSMFDISNPSDVKEIHKTVISGYFSSQAFYNYKSVLIDPVKNLFGFESEKDYFVYSYDKKTGFIREFEFKNANQIQKSDIEICYDNQGQQIRGTYIGNYFYLMKEKEGIETYDLTTKKRIGELNYE